MKAGITSRRMAPIVAVPILLALSSCMPSTAPTKVETPAISWEPAAPAFDDPVAEAASNSILGWVLAQNSADFTIEQLTSTTTDRRIEEVYDQFETHYVHVEAKPRIYVGPIPHTIIDVTETAGGAEVQVCYASAEWYVETGHPEPSVDLSVDGTTTTLIMVEGTDGELKVDEVRGSDAPCDASGIAVGRFDPQPAIRDAIDESDIRKPLFLDQG